MSKYRKRIAVDKLLKVRIESSCICFGPCPEPTDEIEQHLTLTKDGQVFYSVYCFGHGSKYICSRKRRFKIGTRTAENLIGLIEHYYDSVIDNYLVTDVGTWKIIMTNEDGTQITDYGSLCLCDKALNEISDAFRNKLEMPELDVFDGQGVKVENHNGSVN